MLTHGRCVRTFVGKGRRQCVLWVKSEIPHLTSFWSWKFDSQDKSWPRRPYHPTHSKDPKGATAWLFYVSEQTENSFSSSVCFFSLVKRNFHNFSAFILAQLSLHLCLLHQKRKKRKVKVDRMRRFYIIFFPKPESNVLRIMEMRDLKTCFDNTRRNGGDYRRKGIQLSGLVELSSAAKTEKNKIASERKLRQRNYNQLIVTDLNKFIINI